MKGTDWIGWLSSGILLVTLLRQVYVEWRERTTQGVSAWLFVGQFAASTGFTIYSALVDNWVFVTTNLMLIATAIAGQLIYRRNARRETRQTQNPAAAPARSSA